MRGRWLIELRCFWDFELVVGVCVLRGGWMTFLRLGELKKKKYRLNRKLGNNNLRGGKVGEGRRGVYEKMCFFFGVFSFGEWYLVV